MSEWVSVRDRLPHENEDHIIVTVKGIYKELSFVDMDSFDDGIFSYWGVQPLFQVTHWMPLPAPPKG